MIKKIMNKKENKFSYIELNTVRYKRNKRVLEHDCFSSSHR